MKRTMLIFSLLIAAATFAGAQSDTIRYLQIKYAVGGSSSKTKVEVDAGDRASGWFKAANLQKDEQGKDIKFTSGVDALNYYGAKGWALAATYKEDIGGLGSVVYQVFILMKKE